MFFLYNFCLYIGKTNRKITFVLFFLCKRQRNKIAITLYNIFYLLQLHIQFYISLYIIIYDFIRVIFLYTSFFKKIM